MDQENETPSNCEQVKIKMISHGGSPSETREEEMTDLINTHWRESEPRPSQSSGTRPSQAISNINVTAIFFF